MKTLTVKEGEETRLYCQVVAGRCHVDWPARDYGRARHHDAAVLALWPAAPRTARRGVGTGFYCLNVAIANFFRPSVFFANLWHHTMNHI